MAVNLSPVGGAAAQFFTNSGVPLTGGKLYTYLAGTTTPVPTYTTSAGNVNHTNPIILDSAGRVPSGGEIWLADALSYKFVLKDGADVTIATYDNLIGINGNVVNYSNQIQTFTATPGQTVVTLPAIYVPGTNALQVFVDGLRMYPGDYTETSNTTITFAVAFAGGENILVAIGTAIANSVNSVNVGYFPVNGVATNVSAKLNESISVEDFGAVGDGVTDDSAAFQAAVNYAITIVGAQQLNSVGVEINLGPKKYFLGSTVTVTGGGISFRGSLGRGSMVTGNVLLFNVGDYTNIDRLSFVSFENIQFRSSVATNSTAGVKLYRTTRTSFVKCIFSGFNIGLDCYRASTTFIERCWFFSSQRTAQAQAFIRMQGTDESLFPTPAINATSGGGFHITDCEFDGIGSGGAVDTTYGIEVKSVDGLYITQCHWTDCVYALALAPEATGANRTIANVYVANSFFDEPSTIASNPKNVLVEGTVKENILLNSGAIVSSLYRNITFVGGSVRAANEADNCVCIAVTDGDSWWDSGKRVEAITFSGVLLSQARESAFVIFGASNSPTNTYVEPRGVVIDGCVFYENASGGALGSNEGSAITARCESITVTSCEFLADQNASEYIVSLVTTKQTDDYASSAVVSNNNFTEANTYTLRPVNITRSETGANILQVNNLYPGTGRQTNDVYKVTTTNATPTNIWQYTVPQGTSGFAEISVTGSTSAGDKAVVYTFSVGFRRNASATSLSTGTTNWTLGVAWNPDSFAAAPTATLVGDVLTVTVTGIASTTIDWAAQVQMTMAR